MLQRRAVDGHALASVPPSVQKTVSSQGHPLQAPVRALMEPHFRRDFSNVQVHTDGQAEASVADVNALAYTVGEHVVFGRGQYDPSSTAGQRLIAHELTHVVQQAEGETPTVQRDDGGTTTSEPDQMSAAEVETQVASFISMVHDVAISRVRQNKKSLEVWRLFLDTQLSPAQVMGQTLAMEAQQLGQVAQAGGFRTQDLYAQWANTSNPGFRYLYQEQIHGRARACTGCHIANLAWGLERQNTRDWLTPTQQLTLFSWDFPATRTPQPSGQAARATAPTALPTTTPRPATPSTAPAAQTAQADPRTAALRQAIERIHPFLQQLAYRYQVLPNDVINRDLSPTDLVSLIHRSIQERQDGYDAFIQHIQSGDVNLLVLEQIVNALLPAAPAPVRHAIEAKLAHERRMKAIADAIFSVAKAALLLLIIFPPTSALGIGIAVAGGGLVAMGGALHYEEGSMLSLTRGLDDVVAPAEQNRAVGLMMSGAMDMVSGALTFAGGISAWSSRLSAASSTELSLATRSAEGLAAGSMAGKTITRGPYTVTFSADGMTAVATSSLDRTLVMFINQEGIQAFRMTGNGLQMIGTRTWAEMGGGFSSAASAPAQSTALARTGSSALVPTGGSSTSLGFPAAEPMPFPVMGPRSLAPAADQPFGLLSAGRQPFGYFPRTPSPLLLGTGNPTTLSWQQVRNLRGPERWQAAENYITELYGGQGQVHRPITPSPQAAPFPVETPGGRFTDTTAAGGAGQTLGIEVKTYLRWRTVGGAAREQTVPLTDKIREQVAKDVALRAADRTFDPRWIFTDAPPSPQLANYLRSARITFIIMH